MQGRSSIAGWSAAALVAGAVLRALFLRHHAQFIGDTLVYGDLAHNMVAHHIYGFSELGQHGEPVIRSTLIRLPGFPLFLAACFAVFGQANYQAVLCVQVVIDLVSCSLLGALAARLLGMRAGLAVLWLAALCPFTANYSAAVLTETCSLFCIVLAFFALERWLADRESLRWGAVLGLALVGAVMLRPEQALLGVAVVPVMSWVAWRRGNGWKAVAVCVAVIAVPIAAWTLRNWRTMHAFQPIAPKYANDPGEFVSYGFYRWYRGWSAGFESTVKVYWNWDGSTLRLSDLPARAFDSEEQKAQTASIYAEYNNEQAATPKVDEEFAALAAERVRSHPLRQYVEMPVARELDMWLRPRTELIKLPLDWWNVRAHVWASVKQIAYGLLNMAYLLLAFAGWRRWRKLGWNPALGMAMLGFVALRSAMLLTLDNSEPRYTLECFPVVILLAGFAVARTSALRSSSSYRYASQSPTS